VDLASNLALGLSVALTFQNLLYCLAGTMLGTFIGVLPGLGPAATLALLLPLTYTLPPVSSFIMLAGIYYGAQYGGSTTAILLKIPGETSSVVTAIDGYEMARQGRAGTALATAAIASFFAGCATVFLIVFFSPPLAEMAMQFASAEYFAVMVMGLIAAVTLASGSVVKALAMVVLGLSLGLSGQDIFYGEYRLTFGLSGLADGFDFVAVTMGMFGISEVIRNLEDKSRRSMVATKLKGLWLTWDDVKRIVAPVLRGTGLGALLGALPGGGAAVASFASYSLEKAVARDRGRFGKGAIEAVAGPESANNAAAQTSFIPMLTLGIPANPVMALMIGVLIIQGITPGPNVILNQASLFWGLVVSMWIGNLMLLVLNLPLIGIWTRMLSVPYHMLYPAIVVFACIGSYNVGNSAFDVLVLAAFGAMGYVFIKLDCEPAPFLLGFVLGPMLEDHFRRAMLVSRGDPMIFFTRPISAVLLALSALALIVVLLPSVRRLRGKAFKG
jgi:putative tricarboxylic transport membrane protein